MALRGAPQLPRCVRRDSGEGCPLLSERRAAWCRNLEFPLSVLSVHCPLAHPRSGSPYRSGSLSFVPTARVTRFPGRVCGPGSFAHSCAGARVSLEHIRNSCASRPSPRLRM